MDDDLRIERIGPGDVGAVQAAAPCFDYPVRTDATERFLSAADHHLLLAYVGDDVAGMITGVEMTHPDKGTEMFLYELGVLEQFRNRGIGRSLVRELADLAVRQGCYGMWVLTEDDNPAAIRAYTAAGGRVRDRPRSIDWEFAAAR
jgi:ribosomal protein S18 acetylase RimI-like enzyme